MHLSNNRMHLSNKIILKYISLISHTLKRNLVFSHTLPSETWYDLP